MPDIFGITEYAKNTMEEFARVFKQPVYMFDYFYCLTAKATQFAPDESEQAFALMQKMRGEDFVVAFTEVVKAIRQDNSNIQNFVVIGFCFAGRLAYLAGLDKPVNKIVSFYGAGAHTPNYYQGQSPITALVNARQNDPELTVLSFYGTQDESIPLEDRAKTQQELAEANIHYIAKEYDAGHAYFQLGRPNYNAEAAKASWQELTSFLK